MATTRTVKAAQPGPILLRVNSRSDDIRVDVYDGLQYAEVVLSTSDNSGPSADAVNDPDTAYASGIELAVNVPQARGGGITMVSGGAVNIGGMAFGSGMAFNNGVISAGRDVSVVQSGDDTYISGGGGDVYVDGRKVTTGGGEGGTPTVGSPVKVQIRVPRDSSVVANTVSGDFTHWGASLSEVHVKTTSGDVSVGTANGVNVNTTNGDINVAMVTGTATLASVSGGIDVTGDAGPAATRGITDPLQAYQARRVTVNAQTVSGDIAGHKYVHLRGKSVSGQVTSE